MLLLRKGWLLVAMLCVWSTRTGIFWAAEGNAQPAGPSTPSAGSLSAAASGSGQPASEQMGTSGDQTASTAGRMAPLSGAQVLTPGFGGAVYSYILPAFGYTGYGDTNPSGYHSNAGIAAQSTYNGSLTLQLVQKHSQFNLGYAGGAFFYSQQLSTATLPNTTPFGTFHQLGVFEQVSTRRWKWMLGDQGMYLPETPIGFSGFGGLTSFGGGMGGSALANVPGLGSAFSPNQSILTGPARRLNNSALTEIEYDASGRSSLTATASYGTLQFLGPGYINSRYWTFMAGYNHRLTQHDELAVTYAHYYYTYSGPNQALLNRGFSILYGHQITGRLSLQVSVSPLVNQIAHRLGGASTKTFIGTYDSLQYRTPKWDAMVSFERMTQGGSGVLLGAETDWTQGSIGRQLSRKVRASLQVSHAYVQSLEQASRAARRSEYEYWQAGFSLNREFGRHISMYANYFFQRQVSNTPVCNGTSCTNLILRQVAGIGINWHTLPIKID